MSKNKINEQLKEYVTSTVFSMTLKKTHIWALVKAKEGYQQNKREVDPGYLDMFSIPAVKNLISKGLVHPKSGWQLTRAGELVVELLKEAGIYQEFLKDRQFVDEKEYWDDKHYLKRA